MNLLSFLVTKTINTRYKLFYQVAKKQNSAKTELERIKEKHGRSPWLIVANGPSLNKTPLDELAKLPSIGMNKIDLIYPKVSWRPTLIACVNSLVVKQNSESFARSEIPIFLSWKNRFFQKGRRNSRIFYFPQRPTIEFSTDASEWISGFGSTVTYTALQIAYFMEATRVYIVGMDHNFNTDPNKKEIVKAEGPDLNHFSPDYFKHGSLWGLPDLEGSEKAYALAREAFERRGVEIYDVTINGKCQIFKKMSMDQMLADIHSV